jgi:hypothetical protein
MSAPKTRLKEKRQAREPAAPPVPQGPARFYNRELSWLQFNRRVMEEAQNTRHPLLERLRFLSISASNLDEFYMVRVAGIYGQITAGVARLSQDGLTPAQQLTEINRFASGLVSDQQACWIALKAEMAMADMHIVEPKELKAPEREWLDRQFISQYLPILTPIAVDPSHPFPFIQNGGITVGVELRRERDGTTMHALIPIPSQLTRFVRGGFQRAPPIRPAFGRSKPAMNPSGNRPPSSRRQHMAYSAGGRGMICGKSPANWASSTVASSHSWIALQRRRACRLIRCPKRGTCGRSCAAPPSRKASPSILTCNSRRPTATSRTSNRHSSNSERSSRNAVTCGGKRRTICAEIWGSSPMWLSVSPVTDSKMPRARTSYAY